MKKVLVALFLVVAMAGFANAETKEYSLSGKIDLDFFWGRNLMSFDNDAADTPALIELEADVYVKIDMTENIEGVLKLDETAAANKGLGIGDVNIEIDLAYIKIKEMYWEPFTFIIGKQAWTQPLRPEHTLRRGSEFGNTRIEGAAGIRMLFEFDQITLAIDWQKINDATGNTGPNPYTVPATQGNLTGQSADADHYDIYFRYNFSEQNHLHAFVTYLNDNSGVIGIPYANLIAQIPNTVAWNYDTKIWSIGVGLDWFFGDNWEVYVELGYTGGRALAVTGASDVDVAGFAGVIGLVYTWNQVDIKPFLGVEVIYYEGNDADRNGNLTDMGWINYANEYRRALVFERRSTLNNPWSRESEGFYDVVDYNNYWAARLYGGLLSIWDGRISLEGWIHYFQATDETLDNARGNKIGWELDIIAVYHYSEDLTFSLGLGYFDAHDDFVENRAAEMGATTFTNVDDDAAWVIIFNTTLKW